MTCAPIKDLDQALHADSRLILYNPSNVSNIRVYASSWSANTDQTAHLSPLDARHFLDFAVPRRISDLLWKWNLSGLVIMFLDEDTRSLPGYLHQVIKLYYSKLCDWNYCKTMGIVTNQGANRYEPPHDKINNHFVGFVMRRLILLTVWNIGRAMDYGQGVD